MSLYKNYIPTDKVKPSNRDTKIINKLSESLTDEEKYSQSDISINDNNNISKYGPLNVDSNSSNYESDPSNTSSVSDSEDNSNSSSNDRSSSNSNNSSSSDDRSNSNSSNSGSDYSDRESECYKKKKPFYDSSTNTIVFVIILTLIFIVLASPTFSNWLACYVPDPYFRLFTQALIFFIIAFILDLSLSYCGNKRKHGLHTK